MRVRVNVKGRVRVSVKVRGKVMLSSVTLSQASVSAAMGADVTLPQITASGCVCGDHARVGGSGLGLGCGLGLGLGLRVKG